MSSCIIRLCANLKKSCASQRVKRKKKNFQSPLFKFTKTLNNTQKICYSYYQRSYHTQIICETADLIGWVAKQGTQGRDSGSHDRVHTVVTRPAQQEYHAALYDAWNNGRLDKLIQRAVLRLQTNKNETCCKKCILETRSYQIQSKVSLCTVKSARTRQGSYKDKRIKKGDYRFYIFFSFNQKQTCVHYILTDGCKHTNKTNSFPFPSKTAN
jgi:hypothetical protein